MAHAKCSPSKLSRIIKCPGSVGLCAGVQEQKQSSFAAEGSMLHLATERALDLLTMGEEVSCNIVSPPLDMDQRSAVQDCLDYAWELERKAYLRDSTPIITIEQQVTLVGYGIEDVWGTLDYSILAGGILDITDWKFGKGVEVSAEENDQLYAYAAGKIKNLEALRQLREIRIHVVQPRIGNYSVVTITPAELERWIIHTLMPALDATLQKKPPFCPGESQCRWCDAKLAKPPCEHHTKFAQGLASEVFSAHAQLPGSIDDEKVAMLLENSNLIIQYLKDLKAYAINQIKTGAGFPGKKVVAGKSNRAWLNADDAKDTLLLYVDEDELFTKKFVSPAQAEKLLTREQKISDEFKSLIVKPPGAPTLVDESDRRPALPISAENVFSEMAK